MSGHKFKECDGNGCNGCPVCSWGAGICTVCDCVEGTLATECPGEPVDSDTQDRTFTCETDFRGGRWVVPARDSAGRVLRITNGSSTLH